MADETLKAEWSKRSPTRINIVRAILGLVVILPIVAFAWSCFFPPHCIVEGTWIDTPTGRRRIEDLRVGDDVQSGEPGGCYRTGKVMRSIPARAFGYLRIRLSNGEELCVTGVHPIWAAGQWVPAEKLVPGTILEGPEGSKSVVSVATNHSWVRVYDLEVVPDPNFVASGVMVHNKSVNDRNAFFSLKTIVSAQSYFRDNDLSGNRVKSYWVGDVAGLYKLAGKDLKYIEQSVALADLAPLEDLSRIGERSTKAGYYFATIALKADGTPYDNGSHRNRFEYAVCAFPSSRQAGRLTLIVNESGAVYKKEIPNPARIPMWPSNLEAEGWSKME